MVPVETRGMAMKDVPLSPHRPPTEETLSLCCDRKGQLVLITILIYEF